MKSILFFIIALASFDAVEIFSQSYNCTVKKDNSGFLYYFRGEAEFVYTPPKDNELSEWQELPFEWEFYGEQVSGYFISDNGYITFDPDALESIPGPEAMPSGEAPNNAIYAFWTDLHTESGNSQWTNQVMNATIGDAPDRIHVIYWMGVVPKDESYSSSNISFCIAIREKGGFDIVYTVSHAQNLTGVVGCENFDGSLASIVEGGSEFDFPPVGYGSEDDISYMFRYTEYKLDAALTKVFLPEHVAIGEEIRVSGIVQNVGSHQIISHDVSYTVDGGEEYTELYNDLILQPNETNEFIHTNKWTANEAGIHIFKVWVGHVDDGTDFTVGDENPTNDTLYIPVTVRLGNPSPKRVLLEEFTGTWCGWCPDGALKIDEILDLYPETIVLSYHNGSKDNMTTEIGDELAKTFYPFNPSAMVDRKVFDDQTTPILQRSLWLTMVEQQLNEFSPLALEINHDYENSTRKLNLEVSLNFSDYPLGKEIRLNVLLVEDSISGGGPGWDQKNFYSNNPDYKDHPFYNEPDPIPGYTHRHVFRESFTGTWGESVAQTVYPGESISYTYSRILPVNYDQEKVSVVAFVNYYDEENNILQVINAQEEELLISSGIGDLQKLNLKLYPNPCYDYAILEYAGNSELFELDITDCYGQTVRRIKKEYLLTGTKIYLNFSGLPAGCYFLRLKTRDSNGIFGIIHFGEK